MKFVTVLGIMFIALLFSLYVWPQMEKSNKKDKAVYLLLTGLSLISAAVLVYFPGIKGPYDMLELLFGSLGKHLSP